MRCDFFILSLFLLFNQSMGDKCHNHLDSLGTAQMFFVRCITTHAVPVEMCIGCKEFYDGMLEAYNTLLSDKNCTSKYIDSDRLNIVSTTQSILIGSWDKAFCDDCSANGNFNVFNDKYISFVGCVNDTTKKEGHVCTGCLPNYKDLNDFYIRLDQHNNGKVCYDIQDKMNRTRVEWSTYYKCCHRTFDITLFATASSFCAVLPLLFYLGMFLHGKRRERNHGVLDADAEDVAPLNTEDNTPLISEVTGPSQQNTDVAPIPTLVPTPAKSLHIESDSDESDYGSKSKIL